MIRPLLLLASLALTTAWAQPADQIKTGLKLLTGAIDDASSLKAPANQIYVYTSAAQVFETSRPAQALELFDTAFETSERALTRDPFRRVSLEQTRRHLILQVAALDSKHALKLLVASERDDANSGRHAPDDSFKTELVGASAQRKPESALNVALDELASSLLPDAASTYFILRASSPDTASVLVPAIVAQIVTGTPDLKTSSARIALQLFSSLHAENSPVPPALITYIAAIVLAEDSSEDLLLPESLDTYIAVLDPVDPDKAQQLRQRAETEKTKADPYTPERLTALLESKDYEAALATANQAPGPMKSFAFEQIALTTLRSGDTARAEQIATARITDSATRQRIANTIAAGRPQEPEAQTQTPQSQRSQKDLAALLSGIRAGTKPQAGQIKAEIEELNELIEKQSNLEEQFGPALVNEDEFVHLSFSPVFEIVDAITAHVAALTDTDPARALTLIAQFKRPEFRAISKLHLALLLLHDKTVPPQ